jgi:prevent-host-death family protein
LRQNSGVKPLQLQEAKQQFSAVAEKAAGGKPQIVTKHGKPFVVIVGVGDWRKATRNRRTALEVLRSCPVDLTELEIGRSREGPRPISL